MSARQLLRGFSLLAATMVLTQVLGFAALAVAARRLGAEHLGTATFALGLAAYFNIPANFGLAIRGTGEIAASPDERRRVAGEVLAARAAMGLGSALLLVVLTPVLAVDATTRVVIPLAALMIAVEVLAGEWILLGLQRPGRVAACRLLGQAVYAVLVVAALPSGASGARAFVLLSVVSIGLMAVTSLAFAVHEIGRPALRAAASDQARRMRASAPFGFGVVMVQGYLGCGIVLLAYLEGAAAAGEYGVAQKLPLALLGISGYWASTLYAHAARMLREDRERLRRDVDRFTTYALALALALAAAALPMGHDLMGRLFGPEFATAGGAFALLTAAAALSIVTVNYGSVLNAAGQERRYAAIVGAGAVLCVALTLVLVPAAGPAGAAGAVLVAEAAILVLMLRRYARVLGRPRVDAASAGRAVVCTATMLAVLALAGPQLDVLAQVAVAVAAYASAAVGLALLGRGRRVPAALPAVVLTHDRGPVA